MAGYIYRMRGHYSTTGKFHNWDSPGVPDRLKTNTGLPDPENVSDVLVEKRVTVPATPPGESGGDFARPQMVVDEMPSYALVDLDDDAPNTPQAGTQMSLHTFP